MNFISSSEFSLSALGPDWFRFGSSTSWTRGEVVDYSASFTRRFDVAALPASVLIVQGFGSMHTISADGVVGSGVTDTGAASASIHSLMLIGFGSVLYTRRRVKSG